MTPPITITLELPPEGKARARAAPRGGHIRHFTPAPTRSYEGMIRAAARAFGCVIATASKAAPRFVRWPPRRRPRSSVSATAYSPATPAKPGGTSND
jgi:hypothetical protein